MTESDNHNDASEFEIFFRAADRLYLESCATAVVQSGKSVVVASKSKEMLDYYGAALIQRLKKALPETSVEVFLPTDASAMLHQFNKLLGTLTLDVATQHRHGLFPEKIWVIRDANALTTHELNLFTRLILKFPGAGIGAVLMFATVNEQVNQLAYQNEQFLSWILEFPTPEQKIAVIEQSKINGNEEVVFDFLNHIAEANSKETSHSNGAMASDDPLEKVLAQEMSLGYFKINKLGKMRGIFMVFLLAIVVGVSAWLYPWLNKETSLFNGLVQPESTEQKLPILSPEVAKAKPTEKVEAEDRVSSISTVKTKDVSAALPQPEKIIEPLPAIAVKGQMWLEGLPDNIFLLEHGVYETVKQAQAAMKGKAWLANARIIPGYQDEPNTPKFVVVTGPFRSRDRAKNTITRLDLSSEVVIKSQVSLLKQSTP